MEIIQLLENLTENRTGFWKPAVILYGRLKSIQLLGTRHEIHTAFRVTCPAFHNIFLYYVKVRNCPSSHLLDYCEIGHQRKDN
jgi:hypothetical protein